MLKKLSIFVLCAVMLIACSTGTATTSSSTPAKPSEASSTPSVEKSLPPQSVQNITWEKDYLPQFAEPEAGTPIVTLHTTMGDIKMMTFPSAAPLAVENFVTLCKEGKYDNVIFHRVINDFMVQTGDPKGTGSGGQSIWGHTFEDEFTPHLHNFRGAVSMANAGVMTNGSQFFINQARPDSPNALKLEDGPQLFANWKLAELDNYYTTLVLNEQLRTSKTTEEIKAFIEEKNVEINAELEKGITEEEMLLYETALQKYLEVGGNSFLDYKHTVFAHVIEGMDVVDAIAGVATTNDKPNEEIKIINTTVEIAK